MDADELARIAAALVAAIADASARAKEIGIDSELRELVRHSREMHVLLVEAMVDTKHRMTTVFAKTLFCVACYPQSRLNALRVDPLVPHP